jgi:hypothetical protein
MGTLRERSLLLVALASLAALACGARSSLDGYGPPNRALPDSGAGDRDAQEDDDAASSAGFDGATPPLLPTEDASEPASLDGGIDPNGPCPTVVTNLRCAVEGAHLCGSVCSLQCSCASGVWVCHLPSC